MRHNMEEVLYEKEGCDCLPPFSLCTLKKPARVGGVKKEGSLDVCHNWRAPLRLVEQGYLEIITAQVKEH